jgi:hypothetical protein
VSTPNSSTTLYCNISTPLPSFLNWFDVRTVGDLVSDTGTRFTPTQVAADANGTLTQLLMEAGGILEAKATVSTRYAIADLQLVANGMVVPPAPAGPVTATQTMLAGIVAGVAMWNLVERRPALNVKMPLKATWAMAMLEELESGVSIFGLLEPAQAGVTSHEVESARTVYNRRGLATLMRRYFGPRGNIVGGGPIP